MGNRPKYKPKTAKLPEDNIKENHWDLGLGKYFLDKTLQAESVKGQTDKLDIRKMEQFCILKDT